jgi:hypothetical protein
MRRHSKKKQEVAKKIYLLLRLIENPKSTTFNVDVNDPQLRLYFMDEDGIFILKTKKRSRDRRSLI